MDRNEFEKTIRQLVNDADIAMFGDEEPERAYHYLNRAVSMYQGLHAGLVPDTLQSIAVGLERALSVLKRFDELDMDEPDSLKYGHVFGTLESLLDQINATYRPIEFSE